MGVVADVFLRQKRLALRIRSAVPRDVGRREPRVARALARALAPPRDDDACTDGRRILARRGGRIRAAREFLRGDRRHFELEVDAVEQGSRHARAIARGGGFSL